MSTAFAEPTWGEVDPAALSRILVVSPHFDDAAMGAGHLIASYDDTTVVTVLAGRPPAYPDVPSDWDALGGFVAGDDVVATRREEDVAAMAVLESATTGSSSPTTSTWPPRTGRRRPTSHPSSVPPSPRESDLRLLPMGLGNPDHVMVHDACLLVRQEQPEREWFCYEDHGYKHLPGMLAWRVAKLLRPSPGPLPPSSRTCPTKSASDGPSGPTRHRSPRWSGTTPPTAAWRGASRSSSGTWRRRRRAGKGWRTSSEARAWNGPPGGSPAGRPRTKGPAVLLSARRAGGTDGPTPPIVVRGPPGTRGRDTSSRSGNLRSGRGGAGRHPPETAISRGRRKTGRKTRTFSPIGPGGEDAASVLWPWRPTS